MAVRTLFLTSLLTFTLGLGAAVAMMPLSAQEPDEEGLAEEVFEERLEERLEDIEGVEESKLTTEPSLVDSNTVVDHATDTQLNHEQQAGNTTSVEPSFGLTPKLGLEKGQAVPDIFIPSEQVSEDLSVSFPADI